MWLKVIHVLTHGICMSTDDGEKLRNLIILELMRGLGVTVDFKGCDQAMLGCFFNVAFGSLLNFFPRKMIDKELTVTGLSPLNQDMVKRALDTTEEWLSLSTEEKAFRSNAWKVAVE